MLQPLQKLIEQFQTDAASMVLKQLVSHFPAAAHPGQAW
jgi:hypothetical protein